jgi:spore coat polysaccharide biosynthesis predicted glycosyltransferase SpsG
MCEDIKKYSKNVQNINISFGFNEKKIITRILMELYCKSENIELVKECPNPQMASRKTNINVTKGNFF